MKSLTEKWELWTRRGGVNNPSVETRYPLKNGKELEDNHNLPVQMSALIF